MGAGKQGVTHSDQIARSTPAQVKSERSAIDLDLIVRTIPAAAARKAMPIKQHKTTFERVCIFNFQMMKIGDIPRKQSVMIEKTRVQVRTWTVSVKAW